MEKRKRKKKILRRTVAVFLFAAALLCLLVAGSIASFAQKDATKSADVAIVLGAEVFGDEPSPVFEERIKQGVSLYKSGTVKVLIFTGGKTKGNELAESAVAKAYALAQGVPEKDIVIEKRSTTTEENMKYAKEIMDEYSYETALVVSDPLHMKRAMLMAGDYGITALSSPTPTTRYVTFFPKAKFLLRETALYIGYGITRFFR